MMFQDEKKRKGKKSQESLIFFASLALPLLFKGKSCGNFSTVSLPNTFSINKPREDVFWVGCCIAICGALVFWFESRLLFLCLAGKGKRKRTVIELIPFSPSLLRF
jgi:hypothetical protein